MATKTCIEDLFGKYLDNQCSPEEVNVILGYFDDPGKEAFLKGLINKTFENSDVEDDMDEWVPGSDETAVIKKPLNPGKGKLLPIFRRAWFLVAATALCY